jgi:hypothetical protein
MGALEGILAKGDGFEVDIAFAVGLAVSIDVDVVGDREGSKKPVERGKVLFITPFAPLSCLIGLHPIQRANKKTNIKKNFV